MGNLSCTCGGDVDDPELQRVPDPGIAMYTEADPGLEMERAAESAFDFLGG